MAGSRGLMIIFRADQGKTRSLSGHEKRCAFYLIRNLVIANQIIRMDRRASFYVPFRACLYEWGLRRGGYLLRRLGGRNC
jgi:hypothetical protein